MGKLLDYYKEKGMERRMGIFIDRIGFEKVSQDILGK
jgi:dissimilatory sulfite reductase (desulfoviridin) alpha/beta subunit